MPRPRGTTAVICAAVAAAAHALSGSAAVSSAGSRVGVAGCGFPAVKPKAIVNAHGDCVGRGRLDLRKLKWTSYGGDTARAMGLRDRFVFCEDDPQRCDGATEGSVRTGTDRVTVRASNRRFCPADANHPEQYPAGRYYTKLTWKLRGGKAKSVRLTCSNRPAGES